MTDDRKQYRFVPKHMCPNGTRDEVEAYIRYDTGCYVTVIGDPEPVGMHWRVECYSPDGKPAMMMQENLFATFDIEDADTGFSFKTPPQVFEKANDPSKPAKVWAPKDIAAEILRAYRQIKAEEK